MLLSDTFGFQAARLQELYRSWEDNPDIGFVMAKVIYMCRYWFSVYFIYCIYKDNQGLVQFHI